MISFTYEFKLKPTKKQLQYLEMYLEVCRSVYNYNHGERKDWIQSRKSPIDRCSIEKEYIIPAERPFPNYNIQSNNLTQAKKEYPHLKQVHSQVLQFTLKRLDKAWDDFFKVKDRGLPKFKNKNRFRSFVYPQIKDSDLGENEVRLPKIRWVKFKKSRPYPTGFDAKQLKIVRKATGYFAQIIFVSQVSVPDPIPGGTSMGIDAGISSFVATSYGELVKTPQFVLNVARKLKLLQRRLKKKTKGSNNWLKLQKKIAKLHEEVANAREDWLYKLPHYFCSQTDKIFVEDIDFRSWQKGLFGKQVGNSGIGKFINQILPYVAWKKGVFLQKIDKNFTSQQCPQCLAHTGKKSLSEREHRCQFCGYQIDRDVAGAKRIEMRGKEAVGQPVRKKRDNAVLDGAFKHLNQVQVSAPWVSPMSDCRKKACRPDATGVIQLSLFAAEGTRSDLVSMG
ncbi:MAG: transposase [Xenococcaceae cyanobacterium MO_207.B15]|nr:transposase [Xenococcaceae cyanobacterium MO_207.B15]